MSRLIWAMQAETASERAARRWRESQAPPPGAPPASEPHLAAQVNTEGAATEDAATKGGEAVAPAKDAKATEAEKKPAAPRDAQRTCGRRCGTTRLATSSRCSAAAASCAPRAPRRSYRQRRRSGRLRRAAVRPPWRNPDHQSPRTIDLVETRTRWRRAARGPGRLAACRASRRCGRARPSSLAPPA